MDKLVFTAESVAQAAEGVVLVKIDGDQRRDLAERHGVKGYPTGILFAADGGEVDGFVGYRGVVAMADFFQKRSSEVGSGQ